jgi:F0F1-type ATP synthase assembly protein I
MIAGSTMTGSVLGLGFIGYTVDQQFETQPYGLLIALLLGVIVGMYELFKVFYLKR